MSDTLYDYIVSYRWNQGISLERVPFKFTLQSSCMPCNIGAPPCNSGDNGSCQLKIQLLFAVEEQKLKALTVVLKYVLNGDQAL